MKLWIDDVRSAPDGYIWLRSTNEAKEFINRNWWGISLIDLDHDAGDYANDGGDYIRILDFINFIIFDDDEILRPPFKFRIHSMNPVGVQNMRTIIQRNGWTEVE